MSVTSENPRESLWLSLLQQSSTRTMAPDSTCIIFGGDSSVKRVVIEALCSQASNYEVDLDSLALASYSYFDFEDPLLESPVKVNIWGIADRIIQGTNNIVQTSMNSHRISVIILLDLSKPEEEVVSSLQSLLRQASEFLLENSSHQPNKSVSEARDLFIEYLTSVRSTRGAAVNNSIASASESIEKATATLSSEARFDLAAKQFGAPVIVVGWRSGEVSGDEFAALKSAKELQGKIRLLCLEAGAALVYTNAAGVSSGNSLLRRYLLHRLYCDRLPFEALTIDEKIDSTFVPSGFDTLDLISISTGERPGEKINLRSYLSNAATTTRNISDPLTAANSNNQPPVVFHEIESEQDWLQGLHKFMSQIIDQGGGAATAAAVNPLQQAGAAGTGGLTATRKTSVHNLVSEKEKDKEKTQADGVKKTIARKPSMIPAVSSSEQNPQAFFTSLMAGAASSTTKK